MIGNFRYSFKKLFTLWLPILFLLSTIISIAYIFGVKEEISYLGSSLPSSGGNIWLTILLVFIASIGSLGWVIAIFLFSVLHFLVVEVFSIIRLFKLRRIDQSGVLKMLFRFLMAQAIGIGVFFVSFILIYAASLGVAFVYGYGDLKMNAKEALNGTITDDQEIIKNIQKSSSIIDVYGASNELGVVLAKRDLQNKDKLSAYEGRVLPLVVKFAGKNTGGRSFFVPSTNSVVSTNFRQDHSEKILIELVFNRLKHHPNPVVVSSFKKFQRPNITFLDDQDFVTFSTKKNRRDNEKVLSDFEAIISKNEKNFLLCKSQESANICQEYKTVLASQYKYREKLKADIEKQAPIDKQSAIASNGTYFADTQTVYMRVTPQDAFVYLHTLLHETLHHYSKAGSELPVFINEGITDYLTFKTFKLNDGDIVFVSGYSEGVQTIMALLEKISEQEMTTAYFANSAKIFETSFKNAFPGVDYETFLSKGESFGEIGPARAIDSTAVQDMRVFLGLDAKKI